MKKAPSGLGLWFAFVDQIGGHEKAADLAVEVGAKWVCLRGGDGSLNDASFRPRIGESQSSAIDRIVAIYKSRGLAVYVWLYSRPGTWRSELGVFALLVAHGVDGVVIDAEIQWAGARAAAVSYMTELRRAVGDAFVADAPWPWIRMHPEYPEVEFAAGVDARMLQDYWTEIGTSEAREVEEADAEWAAAMSKDAAEMLRPVWPIGVTYGADELRARGAQQLPPGHVSAADVAAFLDRYKDRPFSLYSGECMSDAVREMLRARAVPTDPAPVPTAPHGADVDLEAASALFGPADG